MFLSPPQFKEMQWGEDFVSLTRALSLVRNVTTEPFVKLLQRSVWLFFHAQHHLKEGTIGHGIYAVQCHDF